MKLQLNLHSRDIVNEIAMIKFKVLVRKITLQQKIIMGKNRKGNAKNADLGKNLIRKQKGQNSRRRETKESWVNISVFYFYCLFQKKSH